MSRVEELLQNLRARTALLPGSRDRSRRPIIFVPFESPNLSLSADQLRTVLLYLIESSSEHDRHNGFVFVVDMRSGATTNNLKVLLKILEEDLKSLTALVYVIKPEKFWEKHKASVTSGKYSYEIQTIPLDQLTKHIDSGQIIREFGGQLNYNHTEWLEIRKTIESIAVKITEVLHQFEDYSIKIRNCLLPTSSNNYSPETFSHNLNSIEEELQAIRSDILDNAISRLYDRLNASASHSQNPDFSNIVPYLKQSANRVNRAKKEVYDLLNSKRRELSRDSLLWQYEKDAVEVTKVLLSYTDQMNKLALEIGRNEDQAKQLIYDHKNMVEKINGVEPPYKRVLDMGQRLFDSNASVDARVERYLRPLKGEWESLQRKMESRSLLLENALKFHVNYNLYQRQANDWITSAGSLQPDIVTMNEQQLMDASANLESFKNQWDLIYSETLSCASDLRKKLEHKNQSSNHSSLALANAAINNIVLLNKQLTNVWDSRNTSIRQRIQRMLLLPEIHTVIQWLSEHGEPFLKRKVAIGHDYKSAESLMENHKKFCEIAKQTYQNAHKLYKAADEIISTGDSNRQVIEDEVGHLQARIDMFTQKVEARTRLLKVAADFFSYYTEIINYYGFLEQRNQRIRIVVETQQQAEKNKEEFQNANSRCEQAYEAIMAKANQLLDELSVQKKLLEIQNSETINNVQLLIDMIQKKHIAEKNRWPKQREVLKHAAYVSGFLQECKTIYEQILGWNDELNSLPEQIRQKRLPNIAQYHTKNMLNVEEAIKDALRRTIKIEDSIATMDLRMHDTNKPATEAVAEMGQELEVLENNVMKVAREISEHFQWKKIVEKVDQESEDLNKKMVEYADALRSMSCLPFDAKEVEVQQSYWKKMAHEIGILKEVVITFEMDVKGHEKEFIAIDLIQQLKYNLEHVKENFAHLVQMLDSRQKFLNIASQYYKCLATAIPTIEWLKKSYNDENSDQCEHEQTEELSRRLDSIRSRIYSHKSRRQKFMQALDFAVKCAAQFSTRLRRLEDEYLTVSNRVLQERCLMLQQQVKNRCDEIHTQQISLLQIWTRRNDELLVCEKSCLLEILAKQISDYFESKTLELQQKMPQKPVSSLSSGEMEAFMEFVLIVERSYYKGELKKINQLNEKTKEFYENIRKSYHFKFVEQAVKSVEEQSKRFEDLLRNYQQKYASALGTKADILSRNAKLNRQSDGSLEERISQQSRESNDFNTQDEAARKLREPMRELLATERDYINDLQKCIEVYLRAYRMSENSAPVSIQCKEKELFGNIEDLFQFHANQFLDALKTYEQNPELVYCCFCTYAEKLKDLYTGYILNNEENNSLIASPECNQHFESIRIRYKLEQNHSLQSMLIKPLQRVTRYPLILNTLMAHSTEKREMQTAYDKVMSITREANDRVHLKSFEEADKFKIGDFIMQDTFIVSQPKRYFGRDKDRQVFLFESNIVFTKKEELPSKKFRYMCKYRYLLSDIHIVEHIEGDTTKFGLRKGSLPQGDHTTILKASSEESRKLWVVKIRELIMNMPMKTQVSDNESNGSVLSYYNGSMESVKKMPTNDHRHSTASSTDESNAIKQTSTNNQVNGSHLVEMRRPKQQREITPIQNGITLSNDDFLLPLDENHYENLMPELSKDPPTTSTQHKRSTVSSTASSDIDLPPAMQQLPPITTTTDK